MSAKTIGLVAMAAALVVFGSSSATQMVHPPRPSPPGKDQMAIGTFQCTQPSGNPQGFAFLSFRGTAAIATPSLQGQFQVAPGATTPVTCDGLTQQVAADANTGGCTVGPVANVDGSTTVHFVCSGDHDAVVGAIAVVSRSFAQATIAGALD
jgi:hypothetical protein